MQTKTPSIEMFKPCHLKIPYPLFLSLSLMRYISLPKHTLNFHPVLTFRQQPELAFKTTMQQEKSLKLPYYTHVSG